MRITTAIAVALAVLFAAAAMGESVGVIEVAGLGESARSELYENLTLAGFAHERPLAGRLEGQGSVWTIPQGISMIDAAAIAGGMGGIVGIEDLAVCAEPSECSPVSYALPGQVRVVISFAPGTGEREAVRDALRSKGFAFVSQDPRHSRWYGYFADFWQCFPREYTLEEAVAAATVPGVATVQLVGRGQAAMAAGVQYAGVLEDPTLDEAGRALLHSRLRELRFEYARPLKGRLQGLGHAWIVPSVPWASSAVKGMPEIVSVTNLHHLIREEWFGRFRFEPGQVELYYRKGADKWETRRLLQEKGFMMLSDDQLVPPNCREYWVFLKSEYLVYEAMDAVGSTPGIYRAFGTVLYEAEDPFAPQPGLKIISRHLGETVASCKVCDVNGDWRINILDLIAFRNKMLEPIPEQE